ncbi:MAG: hypothetical protein DRN08_07010 [Thermoplasmata archaeon]|nr:MAG: hypothetical protein DRN08_07010 [Thermoplasmata archaeon]
MLFDPYLAQRLAEERIKDRLREAEQERLIRAAKGPRKARGWWTPLVLMLGSLVSLIIRPQS